MNPQWLQISEAATVLKVSERTLYTRIKSGVLESKLENGKRFVRVNIPPETSDENSENSDENLENPAASWEMYETVQRLLDEKDARLQQQEGQIESQEKQIDHLTQIVAMSQKNIATLTDQLDTERRMLEDIRQRTTVWRRLKAVFVAAPG